MLWNKTKTYTFDCPEETATKLAQITTHPQQSYRPYTSIMSHFPFCNRQVKTVLVFKILSGKYNIETDFVRWHALDNLGL